VLLVLGCTTAAPEPAPEPPPPAPAPETRPADPFLEGVRGALARGDVAGAREALERGRWLAEDRARMALLLFGCLLLEGRPADAVKELRAYLEKTTRPKNPRDSTAIRLLRHHATGGGLAARGAEEACYFGLYALKALDEPATARPDLERGAREAPEPERLLAELALR
jgi:hypothetical protein